MRLAQKLQSNQLCQTPDLITWAMKWMICLLHCQSSRTSNVLDEQQNTCFSKNICWPILDDSSRMIITVPQSVWFRLILAIESWNYECESNYYLAEKNNSPSDECFPQFFQYFHAINKININNLLLYDFVLVLWTNILDVPKSLNHSCYYQSISIGVVYSSFIKILLFFQRRQHSQPFPSRGLLSRLPSQGFKFGSPHKETQILLRGEHNNRSK